MEWADVTWTKDGQTVSFELPCLFVLFSHDSENADRRDAGKMGKKYGDKALSSHTRQPSGSLTCKLSKRVTTVGMCPQMHKDTLAIGMHNAHPAYCVHPRVLMTTVCHETISILNIWDFCVIFFLKKKLNCLILERKLISHAKSSHTPAGRTIQIV